MREIKFRVLFEVTNRDFTKSTLRHHTSLERLTNGSDNFDYQAVNIISKDQFTGLQDKNGVDVYEGDILKSTSEILRPFDRSVKTRTGKYSTKYRAVEYRDESACFCFVGSCITGISQKIISKYSVVDGNIHENPELLKQGIL